MFQLSLPKKSDEGEAPYPVGICELYFEIQALQDVQFPLIRLDFDSLISGIDTVSIPESLGIDSYRYRIDSS